MVIFHSYVSLPEVTIELLYPNQWFQQAEVAMLSEARGETWQWYTMIIHGQGAMHPNSSEWVPPGHRIAILISWKHGNCIWENRLIFFGTTKCFIVLICVSRAPISSGLRCIPVGSFWLFGEKWLCWHFLLARLPTERSFLDVIAKERQSTTTHYRHNDGSHSHWQRGGRMGSLRNLRTEGGWAVVWSVRQWIYMCFTIFLVLDIMHVICMLMYVNVC